jgi:hypothetical protein
MLPMLITIPSDPDNKSTAPITTGNAGNVTNPKVAKMSQGKSRPCRLFFVAVIKRGTVTAIHMKESAISAIGFINKINAVSPFTGTHLPITK